MTIFQEPLSELVCHDRWNSQCLGKIWKLSQYWKIFHRLILTRVFTIHRIGNCSWRDEWRAKAIISDKNSKQIIIPVKVFKLLLKFTSCQNIGVSFSENGNIMFIPTQAVRDLMTKNRRRVILTTWQSCLLRSLRLSLYWLFAPDLPRDLSSGAEHVGFRASLARRVRNKLI